MHFSKLSILVFSLAFWLPLTPALAQRPAFAPLLGRADKALASGDVDQAVILYEKLANFYPSSAEAWNKLGLAQYKKGNDPRAIYSFRKALGLVRTYDEALHNLVLVSGRYADNLSRQAQYAEAAQHLDSLINTYSWHPQYAVLLYYRGRLEFLRGQPEAGMLWWKKAAAKAPDSGVALIMRAQSQPFNPKTIAAYKKAITKVKAEPAFNYLLGERYAAAGNYGEAVAAFRDGIATCKKVDLPFPLLLLRTAQVELVLGQSSAALDLLKEARIVRPDWTSIATTLWVTYLTLGDQPHADSILQVAYELDGKPKLALLGDLASPVKLTTPGGSQTLLPPTAVSPSIGATTLSTPQQSLEIKMHAGDVVTYEVRGNILTLKQQATLAHQGAEERTLAPAFVGKDRRGQLYRLTDALLKRPIALLFWSANNPDAPNLLGGLGALQARYHGKVETVAIHTTPSAQREALKIYLSQPATSAQLWGDEKTGKDFGVSDSPAVVIIDKKGHIVLRESPATSSLFADLPTFIDELTP